MRIKRGNILREKNRTQIIHTIIHPKRGIVDNYVENVDNFRTNGMQRRHARDNMGFITENDKKRRKKCRGTCSLPAKCIRERKGA